MGADSTGISNLQRTSEVNSVPETTVLACPDCLERGIRSPLYASDLSARAECHECDYTITKYESEFNRGGWNHPDNRGTQ